MGSLNDIQRSISALDRQIPAISRAADAAADVYAAMQGLYAVRAVGDAFPGEELRVRAGGLADMVDADTPVEQGEGGVVLAFLDEMSRAGAAEKAGRLRAEQSVVIGFGNEAVLREWRRDGGRLDYAVTNGVSRWVSELSEEGVGTLERMAQTMALWTWTAEFASACGRRGIEPRWRDGLDSPTYWIDSVLGTNRVRAPVRAGAGILGRRYLREVRERVDGLSRSSAADVAAAALVLARAEHDGARIHLISPWPSAMDRALGVRVVSHAANAFADGRDDVLRPAPGEVVVAVEAAIPSAVADEWRRRGATLVWIVSWAGRGRVESASGDLAIDLPSPCGDAVIHLSEDGAAICPVNTVLALAALDLVREALADLLASWVAPPSHLHAAVAERDMPRVKLLAGSGIDLNDRDPLGRSPLFAAILSGDAEMATQLVRCGADVSLADVSGMSPLHVVADRGDTALAGMLVVAGASVDARDRCARTPLELAAERGNEAMVDLLMLNLASAKARNIFWETPLHAAARSGSVDAAARILEGGGSADARSNAGLSPLHWAARMDRGDTIHLLARGGTSWDFGDARGMTPLHWAAYEACPAAVRALLSTGADANARDGRGFSPLHYVVCRSGRGLRDPAVAILVTRLLVEAGADIWQAGGGGISPLDAARRVTGGVSRELLDVLNSPGAPAQPAEVEWWPPPEEVDEEAEVEAPPADEVLPSHAAPAPVEPLVGSPDEALSPLPPPDAPAAAEGEDEVEAWNEDWD